MLTKTNIFQEFLPQIKLLYIKQQYGPLFCCKIIQGSMSAIVHAIITLNVEIIILLNILRTILKTSKQLNCLPQFCCVSLFLVDILFP